MEFGEVLDDLFDGSSTLTGYDGSIILLKEIERTVMNGCKHQLLVDVVEVDEKWIRDSEDEINIFISVEKKGIDPQVLTKVWTDREYLDLCKLVHQHPENWNILVMCHGLEHGEIFELLGDSGGDEPEWIKWEYTNMQDYGNEHDIYVVLGELVGFFCLNWTHPQLKQVIKEVI